MGPLWQRQTVTRYVTDTHAFVWHLQSNPKLSETAREVFALADDGANEINVPSIVLVELVYLAERKRIERRLVTQAFEALVPNTTNYPVVPLDTWIAKAMQDIDALLVPDMPDRIIAATAKHLGAPLITRDRAISNSNLLTTVW